jgi:hypothetical protein
MKLLILQFPRGILVHEKNDELCDGMNISLYITCGGKSVGIEMKFQRTIPTHKLDNLLKHILGKQI